MSRKIIEVHDVEAGELAPYSRLTEAQLRSQQGLFIAESPKVILSAMEAGLRPLSLLCERRHISGDAAPILKMCPELTVYTGEREMLKTLTGYTLTRGVLCAFARPKLPTVEQVCAGARRMAVIDAVCDTTNIGAIFRSAAALGVDGILLTPESCDPLNRRAVRVSMGTVFKVAWTWLDRPVSALRELGLARRRSPESVSPTSTASRSTFPTAGCTCAAPTRSPSSASTPRPRLPTAPTSWPSA